MAKAAKNGNEAFESSKELYYRHFSPEVSMDEYFQYEDRFCPTNGFIGYDEFYHLCMAYDAAADISFDEFKQKYECFRKNDCEGLDFQTYYRFWDLYEIMGPKEDYFGFRRGSAALFDDLKKSYQEYAPFSDKLTVSEFIPVYGLLKDPSAAEVYSELLKEGYIPEAGKLMLSLKLSARSPRDFTAAEIYGCLENAGVKTNFLEIWFGSFFDARPNGSLQDFCVECRYFSKRQKVTNRDEETEYDGGFAEYFKYYHRYREAGGEDDLVSFGGNLLQYYLQKDSQGNMSEKEDRIYLKIFRACRKDPERDNAFPFYEIRPFA